jgi:exodeoxyribonuclease-1
MNYVFYDFETSGRSSDWDQIIEASAVLVNDEFQVLADPLNLRCSLKPGLVPEPYALIVNKTTPQILRKTNLSHFELIKLLQETFTKWSTATFVGYNSINFDEEFLRKGLFKTLHEPYLTQYNGNKRADILGSLRAAHLYYPDSIKTPISDKGNAVYKLSEITAMNGIKHDDAHSALADVMATIEVAKLISIKAPSVWKSSLMTTAKFEVNLVVEKEKVFCVNEYFYGKSKAFVTTFVCFHPKYNWPQCFDLKSDPSTYLKMPYSQLKEELKKTPKVLRSIKNNKHPIIMSPNYALNFDGYKQLGSDKLLERANMIQSNKEFKDKVAKILSEEAQAKEDLNSQISVMAEESIYSGGFATQEDQKMMVDFHKSDWKGKIGLSEKFKDERFSYFAKRLIYEENPEVLGKDEYKKIHRAIAGQILSTNDEKWNTVPKAFKDIDDLRVKYDELKDEKTLGMLSDLSEYIEEIQTKYESA